MLKVSEGQLAGLEAAVRERLIRGAAAYVAGRPAGAGRSPEQLRGVAAEMQAFAEARDLRSAQSLCVLVELRLSTFWRDPLPPLAATLLAREGFPEETRVEQFRKALVHPPVTLIDLDTPIAAAAR